MKDLRYLAGLFDGEGCITIHSGGKGSLMSPMVKLNRCNPNGPKAFQEAFGGNVRTIAPHGNTRQQFAWSRHGSRVVSRVLLTLRPHLRVKALEADIAMTIIGQVRRYSAHKSGRPYSPDERFLRFALAGLLRAAKKGVAG